MRLLAFDFGLKNIGVAVGTSITSTAQPLLVLKAKDGIPNWEEIKKLIEEWQPDALVVGIPIDVEDKEHFITQCAKKFARRLAQWYQLPVHAADEKYTSKEAKRFLVSQNRSKLDENLDAIAAAIILEAWMKDNIK